MEMKKILFAVLASAAMLAAVSCNNDKSTGAKTGHVILIGLDGMGSAYFDPDELPTIKSLMDEGCWTLSKRSAFKTSSAINWASMFMGAGPELHGYTEWYSRTPELPSRMVNENGIFPTINSILREQRPDSEIGAISEWETIKFLVDSLAVNYYECASDWEENPSHLTEMAISYIKDKKPQMFTIVYDQPDHVGHSRGWGTEDYHQVVNHYDGEVARILQAVKDAGIWDDTTIIVTADHGGIGTGHGGIEPQSYETPFIIAGKGIAKKGEFTESMMQYDVAATIAALFGLKQPQVWIGRPMVQCFE